MIKPKIRHGKQCLEKRFSELEEGEFFLFPATGHVCSILNVGTDCTDDSLVSVTYYDYFTNMKGFVQDFSTFVQLVKVEIIYWLAEEKDLFQEKG